MPKKNTATKQRVKREDVAAAAGVSAATVSYVLNRTKHVSREVEQRVLEAAARLNYIPNRIAQSLARKKSNALALITADITVRACEVAATSGQKKKTVVKPNELELTQLTLFDTVREDDIIKELMEMDLGRMTPIDALNTLYRMQAVLKNRV